MIVEARQSDLDLMGLGYSDMDVLNDGEDYVEIMGLDDESYIVPRDVVDILDGMPDEDAVNELIEYPELLGAFAKRILSRFKKRRRLMKRKMRGMTKKQRRRFKKKMRRKRRRKITKQILLRLAPGGRIKRALNLRKKLKKLRRRKKKRQAAKRAKRRAARPQSREAAPVAPQAPMSIYEEPAPQVYERKRRTRRRAPVAPMAPQYAIDQEEPGGTYEAGPGEKAEPIGMKKLLPIIAIAGVGLLAVSQMGKPKT